MQEHKVGSFLKRRATVQTELNVAGPKSVELSDLFTSQGVSRNTDGHQGSNRSTENAGALAGAAGSTARFR